MSKYIITDIDKFSRYNYIINSDKYWNPEKYNSQLNEGLLGNIVGKSSKNIIKLFFKKEIEKGEEISQNIANCLDELQSKCDKLNSTSGKNISGKPISEFSKEISSIIDDCKNVTFDSMALLTDTGIGFAHYSSKIIFNELSNFGVLFYPLTNIELIMTGFNLYISIIKGSLWNKLMMLESSFIAFQQGVYLGILDGQNELARKLQNIRSEVFGEISQQAKNALDGKNLKNFKNVLDSLKKDMNERDKNEHEYNSVLEDIYRNLSNDLSSDFKHKNEEEISELKNMIQTLSNVDDKDTARFGSLTQNAAVIQANKVCEKIDTNFIKLIEVFQMKNMKSIIDSVKSAEQDALAEIEKSKSEESAEKAREEENKEIEEGKKVFDDKVWGKNNADPKVTTTSEYLRIDKSDRDKIELYYNSPKFSKDRPDAINGGLNFLKYVAAIDKKGHILDFINKCLSIDDGKGLFDKEKTTEGKDDKGNTTIDAQFSKTEDGEKLKTEYDKQVKPALKHIFHDTFTASDDPKVLYAEMKKIKSEIIKEIEKVKTEVDKK